MTRVLYIEDNDDNVYTLKLQFESLDSFEILVAENGETGCSMALSEQPDIIIMDLDMPEVDGWEAIRRLHDSSWTRQIPIIAVSAVPTSRDTAFEAGCDAYLAKPCDPQVLWSQIRALLRLPRAGSASI